jgi:signal transduction histidine kinase
MAAKAPYMNRRTAERGAWSIGSAALVLWTASFGLRTFGSIGEGFDRVVATLAFLALSTAGALVVHRRPHSPFGWILSAYGLLVGCEGVAIGYAIASAGPAAGGMLGDGTVAAVLGSWIAPVGNALLTLALLLVPDGRLPSARWRPLAWFVVASAALGAITGVLGPGALANGRPNPFAIAGTEDLFPQLRSLSRTFLLIGFAGAVGSLAVRFRGAAGEERQQLKWIAAGALVWLLARLAIRINPPVLTPFLGYIDLVGLLAFVAAVSVAILRYRLYDIDLVINRALVYGGLGACITVTYVGVVAGVGTLAHMSSEANLVLSLVATALVAVIFQPAREHLQRLANRLVYGQRASPYEVLADFSDRIAGALSVNEVLPRMAEAAAHGVRATRSRVRVYVPGGQDRAVAWPPDALAGPFERTVPVFHQGATVGEIAINKPDREPITSAEVKLLADLAAQAGPAFENLRLDLELQARLEELRASRQRIVAAQDAERRRFERDIHDGAQQQFVAIAVNLRVAQELVQSDPAEAEVLLGEITLQANDALSTLRDLARGIYPPALVDRGVTAAVEAHIAKACPEVRLAIDGIGAKRYAPEAEAGVYFCCLEALQNRTKHAPLAPGRVELGAQDGWITFAVSDEGPGFDIRNAGMGSGLQNMSDRMAALGGMLEVRSAPGRGTTVAGRVPAHPLA